MSVKGNSSIEEVSKSLKKKGVSVSNEALSVIIETAFSELMGHIVNYRHPKGSQLPGFVENCFQHYWMLRSLTFSPPLYSCVPQERWLSFLDQRAGLSLLLLCPCLLLMVSYINGKFQVTNDLFLSINKQQLKSSVFEEFLQRFLFLFSVCSSFWYT